MQRIALHTILHTIADTSRQKCRAALPQSNHLQVDVDLGAAAQRCSLSVLRDREGAIRTRLPDIPCMRKCTSQTCTI